jgi:hypothetical protein
MYSRTAMHWSDTAGEAATDSLYYQPDSLSTSSILRNAGAVQSVNQCQCGAVLYQEALINKCFARNVDAAIVTT